VEAIRFGDGGELWTVVWMVSALAAFVFGGVFYLYFWRRRQRYRLFLHRLSGRGVDTAALRCLFRYLERHKLQTSLLLESEAVARSAAKACGLDEEELLKKLGFDTRELVRQFLQRQRQLRKKWNG